VLASESRATGLVATCEVKGRKEGGRDKFFIGNVRRARKSAVYAYGQCDMVAAFSPIRTLPDGRVRPTGEIGVLLGKAVYESVPECYGQRALFAC